MSRPQLGHQVQPIHRRHVIIGNKAAVGRHTLFFQQVVGARISVDLEAFNLQGELERMSHRGIIINHKYDVLGIHGRVRFIHHLIAFVIWPAGSN